MKSKLLILALAMMCACGRATADSSATATVTLDWADFTFSSPASPYPLLSSFATVVQGFGVVNYPVFDISTFQGQEARDVGWAATTITEQFSAGNVATASTDATSIKATATNTVGDLGTSLGTSMTAQAERAGAMTTLDGNLLISVPYTFTFASNGSKCCSVMEDKVFIDLDQSPGIELTGVSADSGLIHNQALSKSGILVLDVNGLAPGTYFFDIGASSQSAFVPEPGTPGLVGLGLALFWRRLSNRAKIGS